MKKITIAILFVALLPCCVNSQKIPSVKASSEYIRITGRVKNAQDSVALYWSGTSVLMRFNGTGLKALLRDERDANYFNIVIDGKFKEYIKLDYGKKYYSLASGLPEGNHTVELVKRNEWDRGNTWFYGLDVQGKMIALPPANKRVIEFFGNSITAGYAIENYTGGDSPDSIYTNNYNTYAAITARHFHADLYCTVKSGIGIMVSWFPLIMPEMYDRLDPNDSTSKWDFTRVTPNIVVINLFQNDSWIVEQPENAFFKLRFGNKKPDEQTIIRSYKSFVTNIRRAYPKANIICALGSMDATREGSPWPGYVKTAVNEIGDKKMFVHFFPFTNKPGHPRREDNAAMAESLISFIDKNIRW